jgi:hypothetical protein
LWLAPSSKLGTLIEQKNWKKGKFWRTRNPFFFDGVQFLLLVLPRISDSGFSDFECGLSPVTLQEAFRPWLQNEATSMATLSLSLSLSFSLPLLLPLSFVLRLPASWIEQVLVSLAL